MKKSLRTQQVKKKSQSRLGGMEVKRLEAKGMVEREKGVGSISAARYKRPRLAGGRVGKAYDKHGSQILRNLAWESYLRSHAISHPLERNRWFISGLGNCSSG